MENLFNTYKKRLKTAQNLLNQLTYSEDKDAIIRISSKIDCYNYIIFELEQITKNELNIRNDVNIVKKNKKSFSKTVLLNKKENGLNSVKTISSNEIVLCAN